MTQETNLRRGLDELATELGQRETRWHAARDAGELSHDEAVSATLEDRWVIGRLRELLAAEATTQEKEQVMAAESVQSPDLDIQKTEAVTKIAESIGSHRPVKRDGLPGSTCRNHVCAAQGTILLTRADIYRHQAVVAVNDLLSALRFDREMDLDEDGTAGQDFEDDFTYSLLTDLLDASPAGRSYAERSTRKSRR